jgi:hypothetical protein
MMEPWRQALETLCKWRGVLAAWHLGSLERDAPGMAAMRDLEEARLLMRVEITALAKVLLDLELFSRADLQAAIAAEAQAMDAFYQQKFPGYRAVPAGIEMNVHVAEETRRVLGFPP